MMNHKNSTRLWVLIFAAVFFVSAAVWFFAFLAQKIDDDKISFKKNQCLELRSGTVNVRVTYNNYFISKSYEHSILLLKNQTPEDLIEPVLIIGTEVLSRNIDPNDTPEIIDSIIRISNIERPGPLYNTKKIFNGYQAAYARTESDLGVYEYYKVPVGNRVIMFSLYSTSTWSVEEQQNVKELIDGIEISAGQEDLAEISVQRCE